MAGLDDAARILVILERERACTTSELVNRAFRELGLRLDAANSAIRRLGEEKLVATKKVTPSSEREIGASFFYATDCSSCEVERVIDEKKRLLGSHYGHLDEVGRHGEKLVAHVCCQLGYTKIEIRKKKHYAKKLGIARRDIDVWAKHPVAEYYQNIEVRNRRSTLPANDLAMIIETTSMASSRWGLDVKPAVVATFVGKEAREKATELKVPFALSGGFLVPEKHRPLYEKLNTRLEFGATITDKPTDYLRDGIERYILKYQY